MDQRHFDVELLQLKEKLRAMASKVEESIRRAIEAVNRKDAALAGTIFALDRDIDRLEIEIEEQAVSLIALHQPAAGDLRFLIGAIKINNDLERIGDHAVNIAQCAQLLAGRPEIEPHLSIPRMAELSVGMLNDSLASFLSGDPVKARDVCTRDDQVDQFKRDILADISGIVNEKPSLFQQGIQIVFVSRNLERVADLATNISEETIYICQAKVIKHRMDQQPRRP